MDEWTNTIAYEIADIPDPADTTFLGLAGGDVKGCIASAFEQIMRTLVNMPAGSARLAIVYRYDPAMAAKDPQSRLRIYMQLEAMDKSTIQSLQCVITGGMINRFYNLTPKEEKFLDVSNFRSVCYIERRQDFVKPLYTNDFNPNIPERYYTVASFEPNEDNDYLLLDRILDRVEEPVVIILTVSPADISELLNAHTAYLAQLNSINRSWQHEDADLDILDDVDWLEPSESSTSGKLKSLHYRDPLADDILRRQKRFHETLLEPHLQFEFKAMAQTEAAARLIASTICSCALADGKYRLIVGGIDNGD